MSERKNITCKPNSGVTILEILVVLAIIALLASIVAPRVIGQLGKAKSQAAALQINNLVAAVQLFYIDTGRYPSEAEGLPALFISANTDGWNGPYLDKASALQDPWARDYIYSLGDAGTGFTIISLGKDGALGGIGEDKDLSS